VSYDPFSDAKAQIDDGLGLRVRPLNAPAMPQSPVQGQITPNTYSMPAGAPNPGQQFGAPPMGAPNQQQPMAGMFGGVNGGVSAPVGPGTLNINGGTNPLFKLAQLAAQYNVGPVNANVNYQPGAGVGGGMTYARGPVEIGGGYDPRRGGYGNVAFRQPFQEGGLATSLPGQFETHLGDMDFMHDRFDQMHEVAGKYHSARGGFAVKGGHRGG
jgi:hypothetical protein